MSISEQLREAIRQEESVTAVARATDIDHSVLVRFVAGDRDIRMATADKLFSYFTMRLTRSERFSKAELKTPQHILV